MSSSFNNSIHGKKEHTEKAIHDKQLVELLLENKIFPDWVLTCSFYFALHCVDSHAHKLGIKSFEPGLNENISAHRKREIFVKRTLSREIFHWFKKLKDRSYQSRYDPKYFQLIPPTYPGQLFGNIQCFLKLL